MSKKTWKLLCLSNGHGEDAIAVRILRELQKLPNCPELAVLPIVGEGHAYSDLGEIPIIGPVQQMPSGGFIYMDGRQLWGDIQGGLLQLTLTQWKIIRTWGREGGFILAVGDIVPLLFAWLSGAPYAFVGTAKSEYYIRDEEGPLSRQSWWEHYEGWSGSVYLPWERWLMSRSRCQAVFPRDTLTTKILQKFRIPAYDLGNPMMDDLEHSQMMSGEDRENLAIEDKSRLSLVITLLPGSRIPEAYHNWRLILEAVDHIIQTFYDRELLFLAAIAPSLSLEGFYQGLDSFGWQGEKTGRLQRGSILLNSSNELSSGMFQGQMSVTFTLRRATLLLTKQGFNECLQQGDFAIALAGTATEQFIGLGKPAIAIPGKGPQYTPAFAEAQSRLLGLSLILTQSPAAVPSLIQSLLADPDQLQLIAENGKRRMGNPGSARRIATCLLDKIKSQN